MTHRPNKQDQRPESPLEENTDSPSDEGTEGDEKTQPEFSDEATFLSPPDVNEPAETVLIPGGESDDNSSPTQCVGRQQKSVERIGDFGDYELLAEIARGGMGVVYSGCLICTDVYTRAWGRPYAFCEALRFEGRARQRGITVCRQAAGVRRPKRKFRRSGSLFGSRA